jgi:hypothetical protein
MPGSYGAILDAVKKNDVKEGNACKVQEVYV